jgi:uncharacterized protein (TIGR02246 family)
VRVTAGNFTEDSVILINKSFAPQQAATPSPGTLPTYAQQRDVADPQTTQELFAGDKGYVEAQNDNDAAAVAACYTRDAVWLTPFGPIIGREAIQKWFTDLYQHEGWHPKNLINKVDGNAYHLIGTAGNEVWATGEWSNTGQGPNGEPRTIKGYWASISVREGDGWKTRVGAFNETPDTVMSFAPQPAATPSPTAKP